MTMGQTWYIGCSGFHYREWKDFFYPAGLPQKNWFDYYTAHFNTIELNTTFYRFPKIPYLREWYNKAPDGFLFSVKVPRGITHYRHMKGDSPRMLNDFYELCVEGLADKLGPVLFQLPKQVTYSEEMLEAITALPHPAFVNVIELRDPSWWKKKVYTRLSQHELVFCGHSYPGLPEEAVINDPCCYYRFHGIPKLYYSQYEDAFVEQTARTIRSNNRVSTSFVYFNNTATRAAINNATYLQQWIRKSL